MCSGGGGGGVNPFDDIKGTWDDNKGTILGGTVAPFTGGIPIGGYVRDQYHKAKNEAETLAYNEEKRIGDAQNQRNANLARLRELFGIGNTATAASNAQTLNDAIKKLYSTMASQGLRQADTGFADASRTSRQNLARVGQLGSGLEANAKSATLSDYLRSRQQAITAAAGQRDALRNQLKSQRMGMEQQIATGQVANPDFQSVIAQRDSALSSAQGNVLPNMLGNAFTTAGNTYFQGRTQEAAGNQGLQAFNFGNSNNRGSIT